MAVRCRTCGESFSPSLASLKCDTCVLEFETSLLAARDVDDPMKCVRCEEVKPVYLLMAGGADGEPWPLCSECY